MSPPIPQRLAGLSHIAERYDALLVDVWGVLHDGVNAHPGASEAMLRFRGRGPVVLMTNAPRPSPPVVDQLAEIGVPRDAFDAIVSSGDVVRASLVERGFEAVYHLGPDRDLPLYEGTGMRLTDRAEDAEAIVCAGLRNDDEDTPEDYRGQLADMVALGTPFVCANPDVIVERGGTMVYCAGALAAIYEEEGGRAEQFGKPHPPIYDAARRLIEERSPGAKRILIVGDGLATDITGANAQGVDALFVTGGIHAQEFGDTDAPDAEKVAAKLRAEGLTAAYFAPRLVW